MSAPPTLSSRRFIVEALSVSGRYFSTRGMERCSAGLLVRIFRASRNRKKIRSATASSLIEAAARPERFLKAR
jgi:hypothetical protein